jgi:hypothetical protein
MGDDKEAWLSGTMADQWTVVQTGTKQDEVR